jgi:hypothetical protein
METHVSLGSEQVSDMDMPLKRLTIDLLSEDLRIAFPKDTGSKVNSGKAWEDFLLSFLYTGSSS